MKAFSLFIFVLFCKSAVAQINNSPYIYDSSIAVGHIKVVEFSNSRILFKGYSQVIDTAGKHKGEYLTTVEFEQIGTISNRMFTVTFNHPVSTFEFKRPNKASRVMVTPGKNKTEYKIFINQLKADHFMFTLYSKRQPFMKIYEISKYLAPE